jgi:hypothetical protein
MIEQLGFMMSPECAPCLLAGWQQVTASLGGLDDQLSTMCTNTAAAMADLAGKVEGLQGAMREIKEVLLVLLKQQQQQQL